VGTFSLLLSTTGGLAAAINWLVRFPLSAVMPLNLAVVLAYLIGMSSGFLLYRPFIVTAFEPERRRRDENEREREAAGDRRRLREREKTGKSGREQGRRTDEHDEGKRESELTRCGVRCDERADGHRDDEAAGAQHWRIITKRDGRGTGGTQ